MSMETDEEGKKLVPSEIILAASNASPDSWDDTVNNRLVGATSPGGL
jgi:hypothetical protein